MKKYRKKIRTNINTQHWQWQHRRVPNNLLLSCQSDSFHSLSWMRLLSSNNTSKLGEVLRLWFLFPTRFALYRARSHTPDTSISFGKTVHIICDMRSFLFFFLVFFPSICFVLLFKVSCFISVSSVFSWYFYSGVYFFFNLWTVDKTRLHLFHETTLAFIYSVFGWDPAIFFFSLPICICCAD